MSNFEIDANSPLPKYYQVYSALLKSIEAGDYRPGSALPYTHELIAKFGVSRITITKVMDMLEGDGMIERLQGKGIFVRDKQAEAAQTTRVVAIINDLGRGSQRYARQYLWSAIVDGLEQGVAAHNIKLQLVGTNGLDGIKAKSEQDPLKEQVDAAILYPGSELDQQRFSLVEKLTAEGFPIILVDRYYRALESDCVLFNDEEVGYLLTEALINKGYHRIAFALTPEPQVTSVEDRLRGYRRALETHNIPFDEALVLDIYSHPFVHDPVDLEPANTHFELLEKIKKHHITAVFTSNDLTTERLVFDQMRLNHDLLRKHVSTIETVKENDEPSSGIVLEIAMIGEAISQHYRNYISIAARQSGYRMGVAAANLLIGRMTGTVTGPPKTLIIPMEILKFNL
jgi:DNA-binding LacI/PurR family transcriptional regulator